VGAPACVQAQQTGLFPLAPIRRERVPCPLEDPIYKVYRHEYFGYHPTCWRRFPAAWGCPSPEAPNQAQAFKELPRDKPPIDVEAQPRPEEEPMPGEMGPGRRPTPPGVPPLPPGDRSPFELDTRPNPIPPAGGNRPTTDDLPPLPPATEPPAPAAPGAPRASASEAEPGVAPLLALPDPTVSVPTVTPAPGDPGPSASAQPAQAPRRQGLLSGLFSGLPFWRR
jgi:hypothetical protein